MQAASLLIYSAVQSSGEKEERTVWRDGVREIEPIEDNEAEERGTAKTAVAKRKKARRREERVMMKGMCRLAVGAVREVKTVKPLSRNGMENGLSQKVDGDSNYVIYT